MRTYILVLLVFLCSCEKQKFKDIKPVVEENLISFEKNQIPAGLKDILDTKRIIFLGETHYVQEHQEYIPTLLEYLSVDSVVYISESLNAFNWMIEDYLNGVIDYLPGYIRFFENFILEKIKELDKVQVFNMDVNHWEDNFINSITEIEKTYKDIDEFQSVKRIPIDSEAYVEELNKLKMHFEENETSLKQKYGVLWYHRLNKLMELEIKSSEYRDSGDENLREEFMKDFVLNILNENPAKKVVINCGMYHAQKITLMGENKHRLAYYIDQVAPFEVYSIAFVGIKGQRKFHFYDDNTVDFNLINETKKHDLLSIIGKAAGNNNSFLVLDDEIFKEEMQVTYSTGDTRILAPGQQFDAIISYPDIRLLESMNEYTYN